MVLMRQLLIRHISIEMNLGKGIGGLMNWQWVKDNKKLVAVVVVLVGALIAVMTGAITWDQFLGLFERVEPALEGGG